VAKDSSSHQRPSVPLTVIISLRFSLASCASAPITVCLLTVTTHWVIFVIVRLPSVATHQRPLLPFPPYFRSTVIIVRLSLGSYALPLPQCHQRLPQLLRISAHHLHSHHLSTHHHHRLPRFLRSSAHHWHCHVCPLTSSTVTMLIHRCSTCFPFIFMHSIHYQYCHVIIL
jgi:hypothetical protein